MKKIYTKSYNLSRVRSLVDDGLFAVPVLQREFVWTSRKACELLDSLYRNYPIGTLLVWKDGAPEREPTPKSVAHPAPVQPIELTNLVS